MKRALTLGLVLAMAFTLTACFGMSDKETTKDTEAQTSQSRETDRETQRETDRETQRETHRETDRETQRETMRETQNQTNEDGFESGDSIPNDNVNNPANTSPGERNFWGAGNDDGFEGSWLIQ